MTYFGRIHVFEGFDVNKISEPKECDICHYLYFLDKGFNRMSAMGVIMHWWCLLPLAKLLF